MLSSLAASSESSIAGGGGGGLGSEADLLYEPRRLNRLRLLISPAVPTPGGSEGLGGGMSGAAAASPDEDPAELV